MYILGLTSNPRTPLPLKLFSVFVAHVHGGKGRTGTRIWSAYCKIKISINIEEKASYSARNVIIKLDFLWNFLSSGSLQTRVDGVIKNFVVGVVRGAELALERINCWYIHFPPTLVLIFSIWLSLIQSGLILFNYNYRFFEFHLFCLNLAISILAINWLNLI